MRRKSDGGVPGLAAPVHLGDTVRTFANPLSYLGGPRLADSDRQRASKESILSIDD